MKSLPKTKTAADLREDLLEAGREAADEMSQRLGAGDAVVFQMV